MQKKAGIITLYASQNYGAFLQGYSMQTTLKKRGYNVEFIKYADLDIHEFIFMIKTKNMKLAAFRVRQYFKYCTSRKLLNVAKKKYNGEKKDLVVIGSDTLWDVQNPTIKDSYYFLGFDINSDVILAYAPSANGTSPKEFKEHYTREGLFSNFNAIAVRDQHTADMVYDITGTMPQVVLDPTLLLDSSEYPIEKNIKENDYVLVYGYSFSEKERQIIQQYAKKNHLKTVSIGLLNSWCDKNIAATVEEFLGYISKAHCIFTSTFHGTIFSIIFQKQFVTFARNNYKVLDLLEKLELLDRNASKTLDNCEGLADDSINYSVVNEKIRKFRECANLYLIKNSK